MLTALLLDDGSAALHAAISVWVAGAVACSLCDVSPPASVAGCPAAPGLVSVGAWLCLCMMCALLSWQCGHTKLALLAASCCFSLSG